MGWKASFFIVHRAPSVDPVVLLTALGFTRVKQAGSKPFEQTVYPKDGKVYVGTYKDNLIICVADLPMELIGQEQSAIEKSLIRQFPGAEMAAFALQSVVNLWGYAVIKGGIKCRVRAGAEEGVFVDHGMPLEEEKELFVQSVVDATGIRRYRFDDLPDETFTDDQVGENFVFALCRRYLGEDLDGADTPVLTFVLDGYSYGKFTGAAEQAAKKPWWKFW